MEFHGDWNAGRTFWNRPTHLSLGGYSCRTTDGGDPGTGNVLAMAHLGTNDGAVPASFATGNSRPVRADCLGGKGIAAAPRMGAQDFCGHDVAGRCRQSLRRRVALLLRILHRFDPGDRATRMARMGRVHAFVQRRSIRVDDRIISNRFRRALCLDRSCAAKGKRTA